MFFSRLLKAARKGVYRGVVLKRGVWEQRSHTQGRI